MAKHKDYTPEYRKVRKRFMERRRYWMSRHHMYVEAPKIPETPSPKDIRKLEKITFDSMTKRQKEQYKKEYEIRFEEGTLPPSQYKQNTFEPKSEYDFYDGNKYPSDYYYYNYEEPEINNPADEEGEVMADLENCIDGILSDAAGARSSNVDAQEMANRAEKFKELFMAALQKIPNKRAFLDYVEDPTTRRRLVEVATRGIHDSKKNIEDYESSIQEFVTILNGNRPLSQEQSYDIRAYGTMDFDFTDTVFDE